MRARGPTHHIRDRIAHHDPRCLIAYWVVAGAQLQLRAHPAVFEGSCIASPRSAHGMMPRICGLIQPSAACDRRSQLKCGLNAAPNVALQAGHRIASQLDLRLRRQSDLATVEHMAAATNELYEPDSSAEPMDAWEFLKDLAARSTAMRPTSSRIVDSKRLGKLDRECLEAAMLSMSGEESWSSVAVVMDARNRKYSVTGLSARSPADAPAQHARPVGQRRKATASTTLTGKLDAATAKLNSGVVAIGKWDGRFADALQGIAWISIAGLVGEMGLQQWTRLLDEAMRPDGCAIIIVSGARIPPELHTPIMHLFAERLAGSLVIALNLGEFSHALVTRTTRWSLIRRVGHCGCAPTVRTRACVLPGPGHATREEAQVTHESAAETELLQTWLPPAAGAPRGAVARWRKLLA